MASRLPKCSPAALLEMGLGVGWLGARVSAPESDGGDLGWHCGSTTAGPPVRWSLEFSALGERTTTLQTPWGWRRPATQRQAWTESCGPLAGHPVVLPAQTSLLRDSCIGYILVTHFRSFGKKTR